MSGSKIRTDANSPAVIRRLAETDRRAWLSMRQALWMGSDATTAAAESGSLLADPARFGVRRYDVLIALCGGAAVGFIEVSLRDDLPAFGRRPVGYVEGVYVEPAHRGGGIGRALITAAETWSREAGCGELVSDVLADNPASAAFHTRLGFTPVGQSEPGAGRQLLMSKTLK